MVSKVYILQAYTVKYCSLFRTNVSAFSNKNEAENAKKYFEEQCHDDRYDGYIIEELTSYLTT